MGEAGNSCRIVRSVKKCANYGLLEFQNGLLAANRRGLFLDSLRGLVFPVLWPHRIRTSRRLNQPWGGCLRPRVRGLVRVQAAQLAPGVRAPNRQRQRNHEIVVVIPMKALTHESLGHMQAWTTYNLSRARSATTR